MRLPLARVPRLAAVIVAAAGLLRAGQPAALCGEVRDPAHLPVPGASISAAHETTGFRHTTSTSDTGRYCLSALAPGVYRLSARKQGFRTLIRFDVVLDAGDLAGLDFQLQLGPIEETVTVSSGPLEVPPASGALRTTLEHPTFERLP